MAPVEWRHLGRFVNLGPHMIGSHPPNFLKWSSWCQMLGPISEFLGHACMWCETQVGNYPKSSQGTRGTSLPRSSCDVGISSSGSNPSASEDVTCIIYINIIYCRSGHHGAKLLLFSEWYCQATRTLACWSATKEANPFGYSADLFNDGPPLLNAYTHIYI